MWRERWGSFIQFDIKPISVLRQSHLHYYELEGAYFRWSQPSNCEEGLLLPILAQIDILDQLTTSRPIQAHDLLRASGRDEAFSWVGAVGAVRVVFGTQFHRPLELALALPDIEFSTLVNPGWDVGPDAASAGITADMVRLAPRPGVARTALGNLAHGRRLTNAEALTGGRAEHFLDLPTVPHIQELNMRHGDGRPRAAGNGRHTAIADAYRIIASHRGLWVEQHQSHSPWLYAFNPGVYLLDRQGNITVLGDPKHIASMLCAQGAEYYLGPFSRDVIRKFAQQYPQYRAHDELPCGGLDNALETNRLTQPRRWPINVDALDWVCTDFGSEPVVFVFSQVANFEGGSLPKNVHTPSIPRHKKWSRR